MASAEKAPGNLTFARDLGLAFLSALLLVLSFPLAALRPLAWVGIVPLLYVVTKQERPRRAFFIGWIWGFAFFLGGIYWIVFTLRTYGHLPLWLSVISLVLLSAVLACFHALFALLARAASRLFRAPFYPLVVAACWVVPEHLRSFLFSGFPWMSLGYSQAGNLSLIQISDVTGFYGVSGLLVLGNATLFDLARSARASRRRPAAAEGAILVGLILAALSYGTFRLLHLPGEARTEPLRVTLLQGNVDQDRKWDVRFQNATIDIYEALYREGAPPGTDLVVLPETAAPFFFQEGGPLAERIRHIVKEKGMYTLFGAPAFRVRGTGKFDSMNRAYLLDPEGEVAQTYDKLHLVPFGEYSPIPFLAKVVPGQGDFRPGDGPVVFTVPKGRFGVLICYEAIFPDLTRRFVRDGAEFLVNITNDAWFGPTSSPWQHLDMATFRAIENRVWLVRAANTGITAVIDPWGRVQKRTELLQKAFLAGEIQPRASEAFYTRHGDLFAWACWIVVLAGMGWGLSRRAARRGGEPESGLIPLGDPF